MRGCRRHVWMTEWLNKQLEWDGVACVNLMENSSPSICCQRAIGLLRGFGDSWSGLQRLRQPAKAVRAPGFEKTACRHPTTPPWAGSIHWWENSPFLTGTKRWAGPGSGWATSCFLWLGWKRNRRLAQLWMQHFDWKEKYHVCLRYEQYLQL